MTQKSTEVSPLRPAKIIRNFNGLTALSQLSDYNPQREEYNLTALENLMAGMAKAKDVFIAAQTAYNAASDALIAFEWQAHHFLQEAATQVASQYGSSSDAYASLGYKKKTEYKRASRKKR